MFSSHKRNFALPDIGNKRPYIVATGWWCDGTGTHAGAQVPTNQSSDTIRERAFFDIWYAFVKRYTNPEKILVVDSASPVKPGLPNDSRLQFLSLAENWGHFRDCDPTRMCGVERAHLACASYAFLNDCDLVYIEQDCLVYGEGWLDYCMARLHKGKIAYGCGRGTPQPVQQSLAIVRWDYLPTFCARLVDQYQVHSRLVLKDDKRSIHNTEWRWHDAFKKDVDLLPIGYGRKRPIDFSDPFFYAQHWTNEELVKLAKSVDFEFPVPTFSS